MRFAVHAAVQESLHRRYVTPSYCIYEELSGFFLDAVNVSPCPASSLMIQHALLTSSQRTILSEQLTLSPSWDLAG